MLHGIIKLVKRKDFSKRTLYASLAASLAVGALGLWQYLKRIPKGEPASTPTDLSREAWKRALLRTKDAIGDKNLAPLASGVAYGGTLAFFPLVVACVAIASIVIGPEQINSVVEALGEFLPADIAGLLSAQLENAMNNESANTLIAIAAIALALFGVSGAMNSLVNALNIAYGVKETRGIVKTRLLSLALTCMMIVGFLIVLPLIAVGGDLLRMFGVPEFIIVIFSILRWLILAAVMTLGLAIIYRYAPDRPNARWQWVSWGAIMATILWLVVTALFFIYAQNFAGFSDSYSLFAGIIVLMMWLNFTGLIVLVGAEVNHQLEERTVAQTDAS